MKKVSSKTAKTQIVYDGKWPSEIESANYIRDLLRSLEEIARSQGQLTLALFIEAAASEAADLAKPH